MNILITTDVFPPNCGGSGWSTYYLAKALKERGHVVEIIKPALGQKGVKVIEYNGLKVTEFGHYKQPNISILSKLVSNKAFYHRFNKFLGRYFQQKKFDVVHAQHIMTIPPSIKACKENIVPVVSTIRDYWPICYHTTLLNGNETCVRCNTKNMLKCVYSRTTKLFPLAIPVLVYMKSNIAYKQKILAKSDKVIAVSSYVKQKLNNIVPDNKVEVIPNMIDVKEIENIYKGETTIEVDLPYMLYVGKIAENKGALSLLHALEFLNMDMHTLIVGNGPLKQKMQEISNEKEMNVTFLDQIPNEEVIRLMAKTELLLFPSYWQEPLSRVLLEALSVGASILAMNTGGTSDIIQDGFNGVLTSTSVEEFAEKIDMLLNDKNLRNKISKNAKQTAIEKFDKEIVVRKVERLYENLR